jgi:protein-disulfide isomerase
VGPRFHGDRPDDRPKRPPRWSRRVGTFGPVACTPGGSILASMSRPPQRPASRRERRAQARYDHPASRQRARRTTARPPWQSPIFVTTAGAILVGVVAIAFATGALGGNGGNAGAGLVEPATSYAGLTVDRATVGSPTAPVTIQIFSDFQCPACKLFITTQLPSLLNDFVRPGLVKIESKDIDVIDRGGSTESIDLAAAGACAAEQNKYWAYHDLVFWNQGRENKGDHNAAFIDKAATGAGLDMTAFHTCDARSDVRQAIRQATTDAASTGLTATPTLVINGKTATGVPQYADLKSYLTQLLASIGPASVEPSSQPQPTAS